MRSLNSIIRLSQRRAINASYYDRGRWSRYAFIVFKILTRKDECTDL